MINNQLYKYNEEYIAVFSCIFMYAGLFCEQLCFDRIKLFGVYKNEWRHAQ